MTPDVRSEANRHKNSQKAAAADKLRDFIKSTWAVLAIF